MFHGELATLLMAGKEEALPILDVLWHFECVVSPRSPKLQVNSISPRSPLQLAALLSPPPSPASSSHHRSSLQRVFSTFDEDGDGHVSVAELCTIFDKLGIPKSQESIHSLLARSQPLHLNSHIDEEEFLLLYDSICSYVDQLDANASSSDDPDVDMDRDLMAAFHVFDLDGDGLISPTELQSVLCSLGFLKARQLDACVDMIARVDENGDGHVDFLEFKKLLGLAAPTMILTC